MISEETRAKFRDKVKAAARELGLEAEKVNITYSDHGFSFTGKVYDGDAGRREAFERVATAKGFPHSWYGRVFEDEDGTEFRIYGAAARGRKYPILAKKVIGGDKYKFSIDYVYRRIASKVKDVEPLKITRIS